MDVATWSEILRELGYPALFVIGTAATVAWLLRRITPHAEGLIQDHRSLVQATTRSVQATESAQLRTANEIEKIATAIRDLATSQAQTFRTLEQHHDWSRAKILELEIDLRRLRKTSERRADEAAADD